jgi:O-antigen/teichoic acid export membrane protein
LSKAFVRSNALLVRGGFLLAGLLALVAPEFIRLLLGAKWLPMLNAFRLMLVFTMLDPLRATVSYLFVAVGRPELNTRVRAVQVVLLVAGLFLLGPRLGITGVALTVTTMVALGMAMQFWNARRYVDYSPVRLFAVPGIALTVGMLLARAAINLPGVLGSDWRTGLTKLAVFVLAYGLFLGILERREIAKMVAFLRHQPWAP